jgi:hypothetical protein
MKFLKMLMLFPEEGPTLPLLIYYEACCTVEMAALVLKMG